MVGRVWQGGGETRDKGRSVNMSWGVLVTMPQSVCEVSITVDKRLCAVCGVEAGGGMTDI